MAKILTVHKKNLGLKHENLEMSSWKSWPVSVIMKISTCYDENLDLSP